MNEREKMLAEGPRVAPEPPLADGYVVTAPKQPRPARGPARSWSWQAPRMLRRLLPLAIFGVIAASNAGAGKYAFPVVAVVVIGAIVIQRLRKAGE